MNERAPNTFRVSICRDGEWMEATVPMMDLRTVEAISKARAFNNEEVRIESCFIPEPTAWEVYDPEDDVKRAYR